MSTTGGWVTEGERRRRGTEVDGDIREAKEGSHPPTSRSCPRSVAASETGPSAAASGPIGVRVRGIAPTCRIRTGTRSV